MLNLTCNDGCGQDFILIEYGKEVIKEDIERVGFSCPHCGKVYTSYYSNDKVNALLDKLTNLKRKPKNIKFTPATLKVYEKEVAKAKKELAEAMDTLRKEVEST